MASKPLIFCATRVVTHIPGCFSGLIFFEAKGGTRKKKTATLKIHRRGISVDASFSVFIHSSRCPDGELENTSHGVGVLSLACCIHGNEFATRVRWRSPGGGQRCSGPGHGVAFSALPARHCSSSPCRAMPSITAFAPSSYIVHDLNLVGDLGYGHSLKRGKEHSLEPGYNHSLDHELEHVRILEVTLNVTVTSHVTIALNMTVTFSNHGHGYPMTSSMTTTLYVTMTLEMFY